MRAHEILAEYDLNRTAQNYGAKLIAAFHRNEGTLNLPAGLDGAWTIVDMAANPERYHDNTIRFDVLGSFTSVNKTTAPEILEKIKPELVIAIIRTLENADPTPHKEYVQWIVKTYSNGRVKIEDVLSTVKENLYKLSVLKRRRLIKPPLNDINRYPSFKEFMGTMDQFEIPQEDVQDRGTAQVVLDTDQVRIIMPEDQAAACYYGRGTRWCTAATRGQNYFNHYSHDGPLFIMLPKKPQHPGEKYQVHLQSEQFMDAQDEPVSPLYLIRDRFGDLTEFFFQVDPSLRNSIFFAPDTVLAPLLKSAYRAISEYLDEKINEIETEDDEWYKHLRQNYAYPQGHPEEGDVDWDAVSRSRENYLDFRPEVSQHRYEILEAIPVTPDQLIDFADEAYGQNLEMGIKNLDTIIAGAIDIVAQLDNMFKVKDFIEEHLYFEQRADGTWEAGTVYHTKTANGTKTRKTPY
jgi:hypothetical protein